MIWLTNLKLIFIGIAFFLYNSNFKEVGKNLGGF